MSLKLSLSFSSMAALLAFAEKNKNLDFEVAAQNHFAANSTTEGLPLAAVLAGVTPVPPAQSEEDESVEGILDADGLPWDERIHSSNKKFKADGRWTKRKNVDEATYNAVLGELRSKFPQTAVNQVPAPPMPNYAAPLPAIGNFPPLNITPPVLPPLQPVAPAPVQPAQGAYDMGHLFQRIQQIFASGDATANSQYVTTVINRLSQQFQVAIGSINDIGSRPDIIAQAHNLLNADGKL